MANPYRFHPLAWWAMAVFWLAAPFLISERWWIQLAFGAFFWMLAYLAIRVGIESLKWKRDHK